MGNLKVVDCFLLHPSLCWPQKSSMVHVLKITVLETEGGWNLIFGTLRKRKEVIMNNVLAQLYTGTPYGNWEICLLQLNYPLDFYLKVICD